VAFVTRRVAGQQLWKRWLSRATKRIHLLVSGIGCAILFGTYGLQAVRVEGFSMEPTFNNGDRLIVDRLDYELRDPQAGEVVVLYYPLNPEQVLIKRVIAKEGDTVRMARGHVFVNDQPVRDDYIPPTFRSHEDWGPERVEQGYYFVMGDDRIDSWDSREWGQVPKRYIFGKVKIRWWPLHEATIF
jgi:signal peptidase I